MFAAGLSSNGDTVIKGHTGNNNFEWAVNPTNGFGEASSLIHRGGATIEVAYRLSNAESGAINLFSLNAGDGSTVNSVSALYGKNLNAIAGQGQRIVVGGFEGDGNTVECFDENLVSLWKYNTLSTVRAMMITGVAEVYVVGDRNIRNESLWVLDIETGELNNTFDHGEGLTAITTYTGAVATELAVAGNRSSAV